MIGNYLRIGSEPVTCICLLGSDGQLIVPFSGGRRFSTPRIRDKWFSPSYECWSSGYYAWRFGYRASPTTGIAIAVCRVPQHARMVVSEWDVRTEELLIERIRVPANVASQLLEQLRQRWGQHCDIELCRPSAYIARADLPKYVFQRRRWQTIIAMPTYLKLRGRRVSNMLDASQYILALHRSGRRRCWTRYGSYVARRAERLVRRWYEHGDEDARDILAPWMRYFRA